MCNCLVTNPFTILGFNIIWHLCIALLTSYICAYKIVLLCGPAVYFVLTNGDFQQREWIIRYSVKDLESVVWGALVREDSWLNKDPPSSPPPPPRSPLSIEQKGKTGIKTGFAGLARSLAYNVRKFCRLGLDTRVHRNELSESGIGIRKKSLPKKLRIRRAKGSPQKLTLKMGMFSHEKSCQRFS